MTKIDIECKDGKCPICGSDLETEGYGVTSCVNSCYSIHGGWGNEDFFVFGKKIATIWDDDFKFFSKQKVRKEIEYWKENDRYLMRILAGDDKNGEF